MKKKNSKKVSFIIWTIAGLMLFAGLGYATTTITNSNLIVGNATITNLNYTTDITTRFVWEGDSIFAIGMTLPSILPLGDGFFGRGETYNIATSGDTVDDILGNYSTNITPLARKTNTEEVYLLLMIGTNDIKAGDSALDTYNKTKQVWAAARSQNYKVIAMTIPHMNDTWLNTQAKRNNWTLFNQYIASDTSLYDYLVRSDLVLSNASDTNYFSDGLHPNLGGNVVLAREVQRALKQSHTVPYLSITDPGGASLKIDLMEDATGSNLIDSRENNGTRTQLTVNESLWIRGFNPSAPNANLVLSADPTFNNIWRFFGAGDLTIQNSNASRSVIFLNSISTAGTGQFLGIVTAYSGIIASVGISVSGTSDFSGVFKLNANTTAAICDGGQNGSIYYDGSTRRHYGCNSTTWNALY